MRGEVTPSEELQPIYWVNLRVVHRCSISEGPCRQVSENDSTSSGEDDEAHLWSKQPAEGHGVRIGVA
ncbi:hypothetical protein MHYP_G00241390 [Metynnis hypsauchen]